MRGLALFCLIAVLLDGGRAFAHAQLVAAAPAAGAVVAQAPDVTLTFSEPVHPLAVRWFPSGGGTAVEVTPRAENDRLVVPVPPGIGTGTLLMSWRVVSADGHPVGGSYVFSIGAPTVAADAPFAGSPRAAAAGRSVLTLTLVFGVGGAVFLCMIDRARPTPVARTLALWSAGAVMPAAVLALGLHGLDLLGAPVGALLSRAPWAAALASHFAATAAKSLLAGLAAMAALRREGAPAAALAIAAWGLAAVSFALFGHAATASTRWLTAPAVAAHASAFIFWIGALPGLAARAARPDGRLFPTLHRFSALAVPLVALLVLSGTALAVVQVRRPSALFETAYGRLLLAKLVAVAVLLLLGALNRFRLTPAIQRAAPGAPARFRRSVAAEIALGLLILGLASGFRLTPPPRALQAEPAELYVHLLGPTVTAGVTVIPARSARTRSKSDSSRPLPRRSTRWRCGSPSPTRRTASSRSGSTPSAMARFGAQDRCNSPTAATGRCLSTSSSATS